MGLDRVQFAISYNGELRQIVGDYRTGNWGNSPSRGVFIE